jgi:predicted methyltransferase
MKTIVLSVTMLMVVLAACSQDNPADAQSAAKEPAADRSRVFLEAVNYSDRTDKDRARDAGRKPAEVIEFFDIRPGMKVLDMFAGGGYYSELLARVVGPEGAVVSHTNQAYAQFVGDEAVQRYAGKRLPNVEILMAENNELRLPEAEFDAVTLILAYHDIYYVAPNDGWKKIDGPKLLAELYHGMKQGAVLGVVDHFAEAGSPRETGGTLHRIDPAIVKSEMKMAGFEFDGSSDVLRNMQDDHLLNMADPAVRGKTDRFVMRFIKPD